MISASAAFSDGQLMDQVSTGSVEAFGELYDRYCDRAYRLALSVGCDDGRAQDAVQAAFLAIWKSRGSYREQRGTVAAWLLTTVRYGALHLARRNPSHTSRRAGNDPLENSPAADGVYKNVVTPKDADRLKASLVLLPDAQQEVITLAFYGQLSPTEIATQLGVALGTVKGRMRLGLQTLRASIEPAMT